MKLCDVNNSFFPNLGGVERSIFEVSSFLAKKYSIDCSLLTERPPKTSYYEKFGELTVYRLTYSIPSLITSKRVIGYSLDCIEKKAFSTIGYLKAKKVVEQCDVFIAHSVHAMTLSIKLAKHFRKPWVMYLHGRIGQKIGDVKLSEHQKKCLASASLILVNRESSLLPLKREFGEKVELLPPYVNCSHFLPSSTNRSAKDIVFISRLYERKDPVTPIMAINLLKQIVPDVKLHIVGSGRMECDLIKLCKNLKLGNNVFFHGSVSDVRPFLLTNGIFLATSPFTNYPSRSLLEAMSAGLAIVATNTGETGLLIKHLNNGFLVPPRDPEKLAQAIQFLIEQKDVFDQLSLASRRTVKQCGIDEFCNKYVNLLESLNTQFDKSKLKGRAFGV